MHLSFLGDKEGIARSDDLGRDLSSVQTLFTKQVKIWYIKECEEKHSSFAGGHLIVT